MRYICVSNLARERSCPGGPARNYLVYYLHRRRISGFRSAASSRRARPRAGCCFTSGSAAVASQREQLPPNKPLRNDLALCSTDAGMAQPGKALDCYLLRSKGQTSSARKSSGVQIPLPAHLPSNPCAPGAGQEVPRRGMTTLWATVRFRSLNRVIWLFLYRVTALALAVPSVRLFGQHEAHSAGTLP